jgi:hypothetical protein
MIAASARASTALMTGLLSALDAGGPATVTLYATPRPAAGAAPTGATVATLTLATPAGTVNATTGQLEVAQSTAGQVLVSDTPTWARVRDNGGAWLFDCDVRLNGQTDTGQELLIDATTLFIGGFVRIASGTFSALP